MRGMKPAPCFFLPKILKSHSGTKHSLGICDAKTATCVYARESLPLDQYLNPGVDCDSASSAASISVSMPSNSGVDR